jgi:hypothetical protein
MKRSVGLSFSLAGRRRPLGRSRAALYITLPAGQTLLTSGCETAFRKGEVAALNAADSRSITQERNPS